MALSADEIRPPAAPVPVLLAEAEQVARFAEHYWEPAAGRPGLKAVASFLPPNIVEEIRSLTSASQSLATEVVIGDVDTTDMATIARARTVAKELGDGLEYVLNDNVETPSDEALRVVNARDTSRSSVAQLAQTLSDFAGLAHREESKLTRVESFEMPLIAEAETLATTLLGLARPGGPRPSPHIDLRDRMLNLLMPRVVEIRRAARYVFRDHPEIQRKAASTYERNKRAKKQSNNDTTTDDTPPADA